MPGLNGQGPQGAGARSGRGLGNCSGDPETNTLETVSNNIGMFRQQGMGRFNNGNRGGCGFGKRPRGRGRGFVAQGAVTLETLKEQQAIIQNQINTLEATDRSNEK